MKKVIARIDFQAYIDGKLHSHLKGDEISGLNIEQIAKLNEKGFIEPLDYKDLVLLERGLKKKEE